MIAADWREFLGLVRISTAQCPVSAILAKVREAAREFCAGTRIWTAATEAAAIIAGQPAYGLRPPDEADICAVLAVRVLGQRLAPRTPDQWRALPPAAARQPVQFIVREPSIVHLYPPPAEDVPAAFQAEVALQPSVRSARGPQFLLTRYGAVIAKGAQAELLIIPDRPWTDPANGAALRQEFKEDIAAAKIGVEGGGADAPSQVKYIPFC